MGSGRNEDLTAEILAASGNKNPDDGHDDDRCKWPPCAGSVEYQRLPLRAWNEPQYLTKGELASEKFWIYGWLGCNGGDERGMLNDGEGLVPLTRGSWHVPPSRYTSTKQKSKTT